MVRAPTATNVCRIYRGNSTMSVYCCSGGEQAAGWLGACGTIYISTPVLGVSLVGVDITVMAYPIHEAECGTVHGNGCKYWELWFIGGIWGHVFCLFMCIYKHSSFTSNSDFYDHVGRHIGKLICYTFSKLWPYIMMWYTCEDWLEYPSRLRFNSMDGIGWS